MKIFDCNCVYFGLFCFFIGDSLHETDEDLLQSYVEMQFESATVNIILYDVFPFCHSDNSDMYNQRRPVQKRNVQAGTHCFPLVQHLCDGQK